MKILELRFKNLNSLYGEWMIDFTHDDYEQSGIFALTGPTGAGKSTILDAVCLALYGSTPRLGKITKSGNEIMSRHTGECYAEVVFETRKGRYRCHWEQRRSRKKADGILQFPEHQISDAGTGALIETKRSLVSGVIEEKTGMDFDRFTRSILLAQGGFDTLLRADVEQKSKILEQMTGTGIYSEISMSVHERQKEEREKLNLLLAEISGIVILDHETEEELKKELGEKQKQEAERFAELARKKAAVAWLSGIEALNVEIKNLAGEAVRFKADLEAWETDRKRLGRALKAGSLDGEYATLSGLRKAQADDGKALEDIEKERPSLEAVATERAGFLKKAEQETQKAKEALKEAAPVIKHIRLLDQKLLDQQKALADLEKSCRKESSAIDGIIKKRDMVVKKRGQAENERERIESYLRENIRDAWLVSGFAGVEDQLGRLLSKQRDITGKEEAVVRAEKDVAKKRSALEKTEKKFKEQTRELDDAQRKIHHEKGVMSSILGDRLLREYRTEKESLLREMTLLTRIAELEDHRAKLEDGKPCPLCGALDHPFARGNVPVPDDTEKKIAALTVKIKKAEDQESVIKQCEEAESQAGKRLTEEEKRKTQAEHDLESAEKLKADITAALEKLRFEFTALKERVASNLQSLGITDIPDSDVSRLLESLKQRLETWQAHERNRDDMAKRITDMESDVRQMDAVVETRKNTLDALHKRVEALQNDVDAGTCDRKKMYGDKNPDREDEKFNKAVNDAEQAGKKARYLHDEQQKALDSARIQAESLKKRMDERGKDLEIMEAQFKGSLGTAGFEDENRFLEARLPKWDMQNLLEKERALSEKKTDLNARQKDRKERLEREMARKVTDKPKEEEEAVLKELEETVKNLTDDIAGLRHRLKENQEAKERIKTKRSAIDGQKKECHRWEKLHGLIGSADGKKYRNFAQGLTFERMVAHANRQLEKMTDRYLLIRDREQPLELNVIDHYQAGEIRSTRNLSGGESFIVSLSLALGLSHMASRKVRVDSLFLDEGFGTLDEETLETSLETLSGLHQDGKLIGVISHISALKDRIGTRIGISPAPGGKSILTGPGCAKGGE